MTDTNVPLRPVTIPRPPSINDNLPTGNPSGKTVLIVLGCAVAVVLVLVVFHSTFGF
jgi:hypothetical protein